MSNLRKLVDVLDETGELIYQYESVSHAARAYQVHHCTILYWIRTQMVKEGCIFKFHNEEDATARKIYQYYQVKPLVDKELDRENNQIIKYEVINKRVSITPCPFKQYPKPMVGSGACVRCKSFKGRNRQHHEVACCRNNI